MSNVEYRMSNHEGPAQQRDNPGGQWKSVLMENGMWE
jgi:hypothetical protein